MKGKQGKAIGEGGCLAFLIVKWVVVTGRPSVLFQSTSWVRSSKCVLQSECAPIIIVGCCGVCKVMDINIASAQWASGWVRSLALIPLPLRSMWECSYSYHWQSMQWFIIWLTGNRMKQIPFLPCDPIQSIRISIHFFRTNRIIWEPIIWERTNHYSLTYPYIHPCITPGVDQVQWGARWSPSLDWYSGAAILTDTGNNEWNTLPIHSRSRYI